MYQAFSRLPRANSRLYGANSRLRPAFGTFAPGGLPRSRRPLPAEERRQAAGELGVVEDAGEALGARAAGVEGDVLAGVPLGVVEVDLGHEGDAVAAGERGAERPLGLVDVLLGPHRRHLLRRQLVAGRLPDDLAPRPVAQ